MTKNKKARGAVGAATQAEETAALAGASVSVSQRSTKKSRNQGQIESLLSHGEANAIRSADLVSLANLKSQRELRFMIERERADGALILSTCHGHGGYFLPSNDPVQAREEIEAFIRTLHSRAVGTQRALKSARQALRVCLGQEVFIDE